MSGHLFNEKNATRFAQRLAMLFSLLYPTVTEFSQRKRKTENVNDLLVLSLVCLMGHMYSLGKKFYSTYLKTKAWDDITRNCMNNL